jgi:hypothetical protein
MARPTVAYSRDHVIRSLLKKIWWGQRFLAVTGTSLSLERAGVAVSYFTTKAFEKALQLAFLSGGQAQKRSDKARIVLGSLQDTDPFASLQVTKHGETRIKNCVKYELGDGWRLVTRQTDKTCTFLFIGDHEDTERWIEDHKGESIGVKDKRI